MSLTPEDIKDLRRLLTEADRLAVDADANGYTEGVLRPAVRAQRAAEIALRNAAPALFDAAADLATLRLEHESWGAIIDGLRATVAEMKAQRDADVMTALVRQSEAFDVTLATVTRERDEARADMADVQARYARAWEALCHIGEAIEAAGHPQLLPERALRVGEGVAKIIGERDELRAQLDNAAIRERTKVVMLVASLGAAYLSRHGGGGDYCRALADVANLIDLTTPDPDALAGAKS